MITSIRCKECESQLPLTDMMKQSLSQTKSQMFNWKVLLGLKTITYSPECNSCGSKEFCCPECGMSQMEFSKSGQLIHTCKN